MSQGNDLAAGGSQCRSRSRARINGTGISECWGNHFVTFQLGLFYCCLCTEIVWVGGNGIEYSLLFPHSLGLGLSIYRDKEDMDNSCLLPTSLSINSSIRDIQPN